MALGYLEFNQLFADDFRVVRQLGEGGMGAVYVVEQLSTGRQRALKLMLARIAANPKSRARFIQEAQIGARVASEHVVQVITAGVEEATGTPYLVMELLDGEDLATYVERTGPMSPATALHVFGEICHAVAAAHRAGIVHRDLKPQNVFLARTMRSDGAVVVKVLDFGIAKLLDDERGSRTTQAVGSPLWLAPEQAGMDDPIAPCTDVWSLGLMAFWMLSGKMYWRAANKSGGPGAISVEQVLTEVLVAPIEEPKRRAEDFGAFEKIPEWFSTWFTTAVARKQATRFQDGEAAFAALQRAAHGAGVRAAPIDASALGSPPSMPVRSLPAPGGGTSATSPARPGATADTERDPRHPVDTAPQRPAAMESRETGALQGVRDVPTTRDSLRDANVSASMSASMSPSETSPSTPVEKSFRTVGFPASSSGEVSPPAVSMARSAAAMSTAPDPTRPKKSGLVRYTLLGIAAIVLVGACGFGVLVWKDVAARTDGTGPYAALPPVAQPVTEQLTTTTPTAPPTTAATLAPNDSEEETSEPVGAPTATLTPTGPNTGVRQIPSSMVRFAGGTFRMGSTPEETAQENAACLAEGDPEDCPMSYFVSEQPARTVTVGPFAIDRTEVSNSLFARWLAQQPEVTVSSRRIEGDTVAMAGSRGTPLAAVQRPGGNDRIGLIESAGVIGVRPGFERRPVVFVTWAAANQYCRWRRRTLPTEAQWELAAGAGARRFIVSNDPPTCAAVVRGRYDQGPCASESRGPRFIGNTSGDVTPEGVRDLAGNVGEWVEDVVVGGPGDDCGAACRVYRGGDWASLLDRLRPRARNVETADSAYETVGFRCAQNL